jgi:RNA polymerase sigma-70 factor (ECF subfamily)
LDFSREILYKSGFLGVYRLNFTTVAEGNSDGWCERLYRCKAAGLVLYGRALGLSHGESEDVLQETFLALMQLPERPEKPENYCLRAYRNRALNYRRSFWRRITREWEARHWFEPGSPGDESERRAMRYLENLPAEQREVIVLKLWNRHSFEEIGELLEISPNTAAGRYRYGLEKLRRNMKGADYERDATAGETVALVGATPPLPPG